MLKASIQEGLNNSGGIIVVASTMEDDRSRESIDPAVYDKFPANKSVVTVYMP